MESSPLPMKGCKILANAQNLYPATPVMTGGLGFSASSKGPQGVMRTCSNLYLYHAQTDNTYGTNYFYTDMQQKNMQTNFAQDPKKYQKFSMNNFFFHILLLQNIVDFKNKA